MPWFTVRQNATCVEVYRVQTESAEDAEALVKEHGDDHEDVQHQFIDSVYPEDIESVTEEKS